MVAHLMRSANSARRSFVSNRMDKTQGENVDFLRTEQIHSPPSLRSGIHQKEFSVGGKFVDCEPQQHCDFSRLPFRKESFYRPDGGAGRCSE